MGDGVFKASSHTGELLGNAAEGAAETIYGTVTEDKAMQSNGINKVVDSGVTYAKGVINGTVKMVGNGIETACAIMDGDTDKAVKVGKESFKKSLSTASPTMAIGAPTTRPATFPAIEPTSLINPIIVSPFVLCIFYFSVTHK